MNFISKSALRPATAIAITAGLIGGGALASSASAATVAHNNTIKPAAAGFVSQSPVGMGTATSCPGIGFTVMHNDRTGGILLPKGYYKVSSGQLSCVKASRDFTDFLDNYQGAIPGWSSKQIAKGEGSFTKDHTNWTFTVKHVNN